VAQDLRANNTTDLGGVRLDELEKALDNTLNYTTEIGAKQNRMEMAANRMEESELNFTEILSETEDIDMLEVLMNLATVQTAYSAALSAGAKIIQPSLVDFID
jgi:flagellar hook-associated protein 3 FlgL